MAYARCDGAPATADGTDRVEGIVKSNPDGPRVLIPPMARTQDIRSPLAQRELVGRDPI
jgi:hypothetical protein